MGVESSELDGSNFRKVGGSSATFPCGGLLGGTNEEGSGIGTSILSFDPTDGGARNLRGMFCRLHAEGCVPMWPFGVCGVSWSPFR